MYNDIKLEKGLYNLSGKSFTAALEELDPTSAYCGTPLEKLDAFERQLKRFNIRVKGSDCDSVEKFFTSTESAVLFPEFVTRSIRKGFDDTILSSVCAVKTVVNSGQYLGCVLDDSTAYDVCRVKRSPRRLSQKVRLLPFLQSTADLSAPLTNLSVNRDLTFSALCSEASV